MNSQFDFRALLLKIQDLLTDNDRHRLYFLLGEDVPRHLRDDLSLSGPLCLLDSLLEKAFIDDRDCDYLIEAFNKIHCLDAAKRLQEYQRTRDHSNRRNFSLQDILFQDNDKNKICPTRIMPDVIHSTLRLNPSASLADVTLTGNRPVSSSPVHKKMEENIHRSRWMNMIFKMPLSTREYILLILLIIIAIVALLASLLSIKLWGKTVECNTMTTPASPLCASSTDIHPNAKWVQNGLTVAGGNGLGNRNNQLYYPFGLYVDDDQTIYVADSHNHRIVEWTYGATSGQVVADGNGNGVRQLNYPYDVIVNKERDSLIICDHGNRRVVRWPRRNGTSGETIISNISCWGLTMDESEYIYVVDYEKHEVRRYRIGDTEGTVVAGGNGQGNRLDQLYNPYYVFVNRDHSLYVSDHKNHRVMLWEEGAKQGIVVAGGQGIGNNLTQLNGPRGAVVDQLSTVYVADYYNHRIMRWPKGATQGSVIAGGNGAGGQSNQLKMPFGLSFDRHGNLYVADAINHRVQKFNIE